MKMAVVGALALWLTAAQASEIQFAGYQWRVRSGHGGPGPNAWGETNVWLDAATNLHLKISVRGGQWSCAEVTMLNRLGYGRYEFQLVSRLDRFDDNVVLGLFNYPTADVGPDATHEIDIEFARWGNSKNPVGNYTVWPVEKALRQTTHSFPVLQESSETTHWFTWSRARLEFGSFHGHDPDKRKPFAHWVFAPEDAGGRVSSKPMPVHINLWLFQGKPPRNGQEVEVIVKSFKFTPT